MKRCISLLGFALALSAAPETEHARKLYNHTDYEASLKELHEIQQKDAATWELIGRNYYMLGEYKKATEALEKAAALDPQNAEIALWQGRAYGRRAETANPFSAPGQASKARQCFERSVQLNPRDAEALSDLFEYYLDAPGFLGGGLEKAAGLVPQMEALDPGEAHWAQSRIAEKRKEYSSAEEHLRRAIDANPGRIGRLIDLARFLAGQGRFQESDQSIAEAEKIAPNSPRVIYAKADLYIQHRRNLHVAKQLLQRYMSMSLSPDDPPRSDAAKLLKQVQGS